MTKFIFITLISLTGNTILAQNAFWNAIYLHNAIEKQENSMNSFQENPFDNYPSQQEIESIIDAFNSSDNFLEATSGDAAQGLSTLSTGTIIIDGAARFLAERFREDVSSLYISKFKEKLDSNQLLQELLPKTTGHLQTANYFDFKAFGNDFKDVFEDDLKDLLMNLKAYLSENEQLTDDFKAFVFALDVSDGLIKKTHPADLISYLDQVYSGKKVEYEPYYKVVHTLNLVQQNLRALKSNSIDNGPTLFSDKKFDPIWISLEDLQLLDTPEELKYFLAGLYQQDKDFFDAYFLGGAAAYRINQGSEGSQLAEHWQKEIAPILLVLNQIESIIQKKEIKPIEYVEMMERFLDLLQLVNKQAGEIIGKDKLDLFQSVMDLYQSIHRRDYALVVSNGIQLTDRLLREANVNEVKIVKTTEQLQRYGTFMRDIVTADDPEAVKEAIKRNVTKFSYLSKRKSRTSFTIMALPSVLVGSEQLRGGDNQDWAFNTGVSCPIGFDLSIRSRKKKTSITSFNPNYTVGAGKNTNSQNIYELQPTVFGLYVGFIDIGAPFSYRFSGSTGDLPDDILLEQIVSPSANIYYSFPKSPITLAAGWQYTPELRKVGELQSNVQRWFLRASWDIPLLKIRAR